MDDIVKLSIKHLKKIDNITIITPITDIPTIHNKNINNILFINVFFNINR